MVRVVFAISGDADVLRVLFAISDDPVFANVGF